MCMNVRKLKCVTITIGGKNSTLFFRRRKCFLRTLLWNIYNEAEFANTLHVNNLICAHIRDAS